MVESQNIHARSVDSSLLVDLFGQRFNGQTKNLGGHEIVLEGLCPIFFNNILHILNLSIEERTQSLLWHVRKLFGLARGISLVRLSLL